MTDEDETTDERENRELIELLNEVRVVLPGVQVLFAFLLTLAFTSTFKTIDDVETDAPISSRSSRRRAHRSCS